MKHNHLFLVLLLSGGALSACHQPDTAQCDIISASVEEAGFSKSVQVTCDDSYAYLTSSTYPSHDMMNGITGTNEQIPVPALDYAAPIKLKPTKAESLTSIDAALGVAVNGVPIYDYSSQGELDLSHYNENVDTVKLGQLDNCGGHAGRGDDYHYHAAPTCMIETMANRKSNPIIGWAYDGYPIYGDDNPDGSKIEKDTLDDCNGQADDVFGYRYHTSEAPPYIVQCLVGNVDVGDLPRVAPLTSTDKDGSSTTLNAMRDNLTPPRDGVENLKHTVSDTGKRSMTYTFQGQDYFVHYTPNSSKSNCFDFEQKTVSNGGIVETGTFCRNTDSKQNPTQNQSQNEEPGRRQDNSPPPPPKGDRKPPRQNDPNSAKVNKTTHTTMVNKSHTFKLEAWADNWFAAYLNQQLIVEDSVPITTERSFNAEEVTFSADYPLTINLVIKDFKQNDTGLEYIGTPRQQMGDGGFIMQLTDISTNETVAVSNSAWHCKVLHEAPLNKQCETELNPTAGKAPCDYTSTEAPSGWKKAGFDVSEWPNATEYSAEMVSPKDGYNLISWDESAKLIWGDDLETSNTLICKFTVEKP